VGFKLFNKECGQQLSAMFGKPERISIFSFFDKICEFVAKIARSGDRFIDGLGISEILLSDDPVSELIASIKSLLLYKNRLYTGLPVQGFMDERTFYTQALELLGTYDTIKQRLNSMREKHFFLENIAVELRFTLVDIDARAKGNERPVPYAVMIAGDPGIGKSKLMIFMYELWSKVKGRDFSLAQVYERVVTSNYWEGYQPQSKPIIHYSEVGRMNENLAKMKGDETLAELTSVIDSSPMIADMAFDDKGKIYICPELVMMDTNNPSLNLNYLVSNPAAYRRRFLYITPYVKPEFIKTGSCSIDPNKSMAAGGNIMDRWTFDVYTEEPQNAHDSFKIYHAKRDTCDIYALETLLTKIFSDHIVAQEKIQEAMRGISTESSPLTEVVGTVKSIAQRSQSFAYTAFGNVYSVFRWQIYFWLLTCICTMFPWGVSDLDRVYDTYITYFMLMYSTLALCTMLGVKCTMM